MGGILTRRQALAGLGAALVVQQPGRSSARETASLAEVEALAAREGRLVWYDALPGEQANALITAFNGAYPAIKVEYVEIVASQRIARIMQESLAGGPTADVFVDSAEVIMKLADLGLLRAQDWSAVGIKADPIQTPNEYIVATHAAPFVFLYNTNKVSEADLPKSYEETLDAKWKGRAGLWSFPQQLIAMTAAWGEEGVRDYVTKLAALTPRIYASPRTLAEAVGAGERDIAYLIPYHTVLDTVRKGAPVKITMLDPVPLGPVFGALPKVGRYPNAGKLLLRWLTTPSGATAWERASGRGNPFVPGTDVAALLGDRKHVLVDIRTSISQSDRLAEFGQSMMRRLQGR